MSTPPPEITAADAGSNAVVRHLVATLAYRAAKVVRDLPGGFEVPNPADGTRSPVAILAHMGDLLDWALSLTEGQYVWAARGSSDWDAEAVRFFDRLQALDRQLLRALPAEAVAQLLQGPLADALTHVGQLALLRGMAGLTVRPESYARAAIVVGRVGLEQAAPVREFDGDASRPR